jgi:hypothetical protein
LPLAQSVTALALPPGIPITLINIREAGYRFHLENWREPQANFAADRRALNHDLLDPE